MGRHKREHPETWPDNSSARNTPEACAKAEATRQRKIAEGTYVRSWKGRHHSEETRRHLSEVSKGGKRAGANNGMFGRKHSEESRVKMSEKKAIAILEGRFNPYGTRNKKGTYTSPKSGKEYHFKSGWEEAVMKYLDAEPSVATWDYECVRIPYYYNDNKRWYVPDFVIDNVDGTKEMWEVKPSQFALSERVLNTSAAGRSYCDERGIQYTLVTEHTLKMLGVL